MAWGGVMEVGCPCHGRLDPSVVYASVERDRYLPVGGSALGFRADCATSGPAFGSSRRHRWHANRVLRADEISEPLSRGIRVPRHRLPVPVSTGAVAPPLRLLHGRPVPFPCDTDLHFCDPWRFRESWGDRVEHEHRHVAQAGMEWFDPL